MIPNAPLYSIIVPVLGEAAAINVTLDRLRSLERQEEAEILVVDGDPEGKTLKATVRDDIQKILSPRGRGRQMNEGAKNARGEILVFLHADTDLPSDALGLIAEAVRDRRFVGGAFDLGFRSARFAFKVIAAVASLRSRLTRVPFGDQALFFRRDYFERIGGYREIPIMEDVELMGRVRRRGDSIAFIGKPVLTSPRRWEKEGLLRCTLRNWLLQWLYLFGVPPERLAGYYRAYQETNSPSRETSAESSGMESDRCVILFVKAPEMGRVKTRLAASLGDETALDLYRCFVEDTLGMLVRGGYRLLIFFSPPSSRSCIVPWLGERYPLLPQEGDDLGARMQNAFLTAFARGFNAVLIVGSDSPDLPGRIIDEALTALEDHDAVLGPARDGGYYLIGFRKETFLSDTFSAIPWSTPEVFTQTLAILRDAGRRVHLLPLWQDVDTVQDIRALALRNVGTDFDESVTMTFIGRAYGPGGDLAAAVKR